MTTIQDDLGMRPHTHTWFDPHPGTRAHQIRALVRAAVWTPAVLVPSTAVTLLVDPSTRPNFLALIGL